MEGEIINRVANSGLQTLDLEEYYTPGDRVVYDLKNNLFQEMILREKDFRAFLKEHDWSQYKQKHIAITCTVDAIVPTWAYMLLATKLTEATTIVFGDLAQLEEKLFMEKVREIDFATFQDARVVVKGCSKVEVPTSIYVYVTTRLQPYVKSMMFGEPCSTVPLYKKPRVS